MFTLGFESAILCGLLLFAVTRLKSFSTTQAAIKRIIFILVCLLSVVTVHWINFLVYSR
jgi:hypothetical protein